MKRVNEISALTTRERARGGGGGGGGGIEPSVCPSLLCCVVGMKTGEPREKQNYLTHSQGELGLSHMARAGFKPTPDTAVRIN